MSVVGWSRNFCAGRKFFHPVESYNLSSTFSTCIITQQPRTTPPSFFKANATRSPSSHHRRPATAATPPPWLYRTAAQRGRGGPAQRSGWRWTSSRATTRRGTVMSLETSSRHCTSSWRKQRKAGKTTSSPHISRPPESSRMREIAEIARVFQ